MMFAIKELFQCARYKTEASIIKNVTIFDLHNQEINSRLYAQLIE